jgi:hypothetical protein
MPIPLTAHVAHGLPGRLRITIPAARDQAPLFADLQRRLLESAGILSVTVNPAAASLVVLHEAGVDALDACRSVAGLTIAQPADVDRRLADTRVIQAELIWRAAKLLLWGNPVAQLSEILIESVALALIETLTHGRSRPASLGGPTGDTVPAAP